MPNDNIRDKYSIGLSMVYHMTWEVQLTINNRIISTKTKKSKLSKP